MKKRDGSICEAPGCCTSTRKNVSPAAAPAWVACKNVDAIFTPNNVPVYAEPLQTEPVFARLCGIIARRTTTFDPDATIRFNLNDTDPHRACSLHHPPFSCKASRDDGGRVHRV